MPIGITKGLTTWRFQDHHVARVMDNAAYTTAHPDDTLVLSGPARSDNARADSTDGMSLSSLLAIGGLQSFQFSQGKSLQPMMTIGSGRSFFVGGKAQGSASIQSIFMSGRNLLRTLHHNARSQRLRWSQFDDIPAYSDDAAFLTNLDSELYLIPWGLGALFRSKMHDNVGGVYLELSLVQSYNLGAAAGQNMMAEAVSILFDRAMPFSADNAARPGVPRATVDAVLGFVDEQNPAVPGAALTNEDLVTAVPAPAGVF